MLAHKTTMEIPIANAMYSIDDHYEFLDNNFDYKNLNGMNFIKPDLKNFPLLKILKYNFKKIYFEIILVTLNDILVQKYLDNKISYITIHKSILKLLKNPYFVKFYSIKPKNIKDIKSMVQKVTIYLQNN